MTTAIVGFGIMATMSLFAACAVQNATATHMSVAMMLANNVQEAMANLAFSDPIMGKSTFGAEGGETLTNFDDVDDFDGQNFNPPIDGLRARVNDMSQYTQIVSVDPIDPNQLTLTLPKTITNRTVVRIRTRIMYRRSPAEPQEEIYRTDWVRSEK
jgi:hypothetical protein